jgi:hypothetical protein
MLSERTTRPCTLVTRIARATAVRVFAPTFLLGDKATTAQTNNPAVKTGPAATLTFHDQRYLGGTMKRNYLFALAAALLVAPASYAQFAATGTTNLSVTVSAEAALQVTTATTTLTAAGSIFNPYGGTTNLSYKIRTTQSTGSGTVTLKVTSDFSPAGGPSVTTPPTAGDALTYSCTAAAPATGCTGPLTASTSASTSVATFGPGASSSNAGNAASTTWSLTNDPVYKTGTYTATVTYTISAA